MVLCLLLFDLIICYEVSNAVLFIGWLYVYLARNKILGLNLEAVP